MFPNFLRSLVLNSLATRECTHMYQFMTNNHTSFHLWCKENLLNHQKVSKNYENDCLQIFLLLFMSLLTALIVKSSYILPGILSSSKIERLSMPNLDLSKKIERIVISKIKFSPFLEISCPNVRLKLRQRP